MSLSIGDVSQATGLSVHALRFFEREGLFLRDIPRTQGGQRAYERPDVDWLLLCNRLRESGMPIATVKRFADLVKEGPGNEPDRLALLREHERQVEAKIDELRACLAVIHDKVVVYERHVEAGTATGLWSPPLDAEPRRP
ncbi:MerR family transcriptional regulator [Nonomuraea endophytica]|uniref:DNA-binding transcriptional MerR regulator n=1 Tax=Nonomuraea endophytica TaxID=714136 RepID=A0A7W7ZY18_9ACTN|nr:MerR family transcriptional regulator [Nonomuraea endophytica]MBB5074973.1 DNA-binding transcriptional MerR regulator [Nonomuraea endophytica]